MSINQFNPDYAIHPGEILEETLEARSIKKAEFAKLCGLSVKTISQIINKKAPVMPETAIQFERVLGVASHIWTNLDTSYRLHQAKEADRKNRENLVGWAKKFPVKELLKRHLIAQPNNPADLVEQMLRFFSVASVDAWEEKFKNYSVNFRHSRSYESAPEAVATWLRTCEARAEKIDVEQFDRDKFISALKQIRKLTNREPNVFEPKMKELCTVSGVALVYASEFANTHLYGATRWLNKDKALIMLSLRQKMEDHFWFSFFHEAAHLLLHGKKEVFLDEEDTKSNDKEEEANRFARNILIPQDQYEAFLRSVKRKYFSRQSVIDFASQINLSPGIVVGRLQHDRFIGFNTLNGLKQKFELIEENEKTSSPYSQ